MEPQNQVLVISAALASTTEALDEIDGRDGSNPDSPKQIEEQPLLFPSFDGVEMILDYTFKNKSLLEDALTHPSCRSGQNKRFCYERLEYIGDGVINYLITTEHYFSYPNIAVGELTRLRAANVDTEKLARVAIKHKLHRYLRHKKPLLDEHINEFKKEILEYPLHSYGLIDPPKDLADIVESIIGAVFVDCGSDMDTVLKVCRDLLKPRIDPDTIRMRPKQELNEFCQKHYLKLEYENLWKESMTFNVLVNDQRVGTAIYGPKKDIARNRAAKNALDNLKRLLGHKVDPKNETSSANPNPETPGFSGEISKHSNFTLEGMSQREECPDNPETKKTETKKKEEEVSEESSRIPPQFQGVWLSQEKLPKKMVRIDEEKFQRMKASHSFKETL